MRDFSPIRKHPFYWVLQDVFGLSYTDITRITGITRKTQKLMEVGHHITPQLTTKLRHAIEVCRDKHARTQLAGKEIKDSYLREYAQSQWDCINYLLNSIKATGDTRRQYQTGLKSLLQANLTHTTWTRKADVMANLRPHHTAAAIKRCAFRLGIIEEVRPTGIYWRLPPTVPEGYKPTPVKPRPIRATGKRQKELHNRICAILVHHPDGIDSRLLFEKLAPYKFSRAMTYRAAKELCLIVEVTGFGPSKRSVWSLPHLGSLDAA